VGQAGVGSDRAGAAQEVEPGDEIEIDLAAKRYAIMAQQSAPEAVAVDKVLILIARHELAFGEALQRGTHLLGIARQIASRKISVAQILQAMATCILDDLV